MNWADWTPREYANLCFIIKDGRALLIRKKRGLGAGKINAPGGKLEAGETPEQCLVRELREEFAVETEVTGFVDKSIYAYDHITVELLAYTVVYRSGTFVLHDHAAIRWVTVAELDDYDFAPADLPIVRQLQQRSPEHP